MIKPGKSGASGSEPWANSARVVVVETCFFFFSSRRRHTRFDCDWSSDVCSSDLEPADRLDRGGGHGAADAGVDLPGRDQGGAGRPARGRRRAGRDVVGGDLEGGDRKSVVVGKECRSRWSPYH